MLIPAGKTLTAVELLLKFTIFLVADLIFVLGFREAGFGPRYFFLGECTWAIFQCRPLLFDALPECLHAHCLDQYFDPCFVLVVPAAELVINSENPFEVGQQMPRLQPVADHGADDRRAAQTAARQYLEANFSAVRVRDEFQADVVSVDRGAIRFATADSDLELSR